MQKHQARTKPDSTVFFSFFKFYIDTAARTE